jgi:hypothetical protein
LKNKPGMAVVRAAATLSCTFLLNLAACKKVAVLNEFNFLDNFLKVRFDGFMRRGIQKGIVGR